VSTFLSKLDDLFLQDMGKFEIRFKAAGESGYASIIQVVFFVTI
jgi:hypothetical protein